MTYPRAVLTAWTLALLLACALAYDVAHAGEWSLDIKGGVAFPIRTTPDGTYYQEPYPHHTQTATPAFAVGLNYDFNKQWSLQAHYLDLGVAKIKGQGVDDPDYDHKGHRCISNCSITAYFETTDSLRGVDLTFAYTWRRDGLRPFVKGGVAVLHHQATFRNQYGTTDRFQGYLPELELGAGLAYKSAYLEVDYFHGMNFGGQNLPISTQQVALFAGVQLSLGR